jgi:hypothetical protein
MDGEYDRDDLAPETLARMQKDCDDFQERAAHIIADLDQDSATIAHDFWLTRNGHGAGFWDGDYPDPAGEELTDISKDFGTCDLYVGDDGKIYAM